ncbi:hypothetical protein [Deinococcus hopiensis]|uniref:hypothetical protein n=1 Tax=Deinococcus hopiensis TaxID=309885 RepID=UPI000A04FD7E|nr:hypothetical protein [Deinococcus hopiensis]
MGAAVFAASDLLLALLAGLGAAALTHALGHAVAAPRLYLAQHGAPLTHVAADNGFPLTTPRRRAAGGLRVVAGPAVDVRHTEGRAGQSRPVALLDAPGSAPFSAFLKHIPLDHAP